MNHFLIILFLLSLNSKLTKLAGFKSITDLKEVRIKSKNWWYDESVCNETTWKDNCREDINTDRTEYLFAQSPVDINTSRIAYPVPGTLTSQCINYKSFKGTFRIQLKGYTIQVEFENTVKFGEYDRHKFIFHGLHFHWGNKDDVGSEHTINGKSFPLEIHFLIYRENLGTMDNAIQTIGWLSVIPYAVLVDVVPPHSGLAASQVLKPIVKRLSEPDPTVAGPEILDLADLFESKYYYWYWGTLTTPSCRNVWWNIMTKPLLIPKEHLDAIRSFSSTSANPQIKGNNFRLLKSRFHKMSNGTIKESFIMKQKLMKCKTETCRNTDPCLAPESRES